MMSHANASAPSSAAGQGWETFHRETATINRAARQGDWKRMHELMAKRNRRYCELMSVAAIAEDLVQHREILALERESMDLVTVARDRVAQDLFELRSRRNAASAYGNHSGP